MTTDTQLDALARFHGVVTSYVGVDGHSHRPDRDVLVALLRALGVPLDTPARAAALLLEAQRVCLQRRLEPVLVHRIGLPDTATATIPDGTDPDDLCLTLELDDGTVSRRRLGDACGGRRAPRVPRPDPLGQQVRAIPLDLTLVAGGPVPPGRHHLTIEGAGPPQRALLLAAPRCPASPRRLAAFMPLHAIRTDRDWGIGTYTDLARLGSWLSAHGADLFSTLPLYPAFLDPPADPSPYLPVSRLAYNEAFIDPTALPEFAACPEAKAQWSGRLSDEAARLRSSAGVQYEDVARLLRAVLEPMSRCAAEDVPPGRADELRDFACRHPELAAYASFRAAREAGVTGEPEQGTETYHLYCQWAAHDQLRAAGSATLLFADFPVGSHPGGFDPVWSPSSFVEGVSGGSPPDRFFPGGQDWGFRPLHPERIRDDGYRFMSAALKRAFDHAACVRIDHVMGLQRLFMIPDGASGDGAYVEYRVDELHALVALEAHRSDSAVVGEDLGTVPPEVRPRLAREGILRTWVFQFESTEASPLPAPPAECLAALGTHDLPRFASYLWGEDVTQREDAGQLPAADAETERRERAAWRGELLAGLGVDANGTTHDVTLAALDGCLRTLARSAADIALVDLEDLWAEHTRENVPGTGPGGTNWRHRSARTLEEMEHDQEVGRVIASLAAERVS